MSFCDQDDWNFQLTVCACDTCGIALAATPAPAASRNWRRPAFAFACVRLTIGTVFFAPQTREAIFAKKLTNKLTRKLASQHKVIRSPRRTWRAYTINDSRKDSAVERCKA